MKIAIVGLIGLGMLAATCAAMLVSAVRASSVRTATGPEADQTVQVLIAAGALHEMTVVEASSVVTKSLSRAAVPPGSIVDPVQVVGRVLMVPMVAGQPFTQNCFAMESSGAHLAAALPKGKRAIGISVTDYGGLEGLLYPGCAVDVLLSLKPADGISVGESKRSAISTTLLANVEVLAIERQTVVSGTSEKVGSDVEGSALRPNTRRVTLLVDSRQAKALQLGMSQGTLSLALRNPLDSAAVDTDRLSMNEVLGEKDDSEAKSPTFLEKLLAGMAAARQMPVAAPAPAPVTTPSAQAATAPRWNALIIRGQSTETKSFRAPSNYTGKTDDDLPLESTHDTAVPPKPEARAGN